MYFWPPVRLLAFTELLYYGIGIVPAIPFEANGL